MKLFKKILGITICCIIVACAGSTKQNQTVASTLRPSEDILTEDFAKLRKQQIQKVDYELAFHFQKNAQDFVGKTKISLVLNHLDHAVSIDAKLSKINSITVNGLSYQLRNYEPKNGFLNIPASLFTVGANQIEILYTNEYSKDGQGLMRFTDPVDKREYIATDSEPYGAHTFFPCFDQPDLKATYKVTVTTPKAWLAINNSKIQTIQSSETENTHVFYPSPPISTYLVFIGAGEYQAWHSQYENIPLTIYARKSLAKFVDASVLFSITKRGLKFFQSYFDSPYPFQKYDHIFVPDLGPGAMENPGAVTMNEKMIFRSPQPESAHLGRSNTLLHEMAHMWFGDLVTMKWWNDLWLNESFATFMAHLAQEKALGIPAQSWQSFIGQKSWAYWQDQLNTTHPIVTEVSDTQVSSSNFDGITYAKGASSLKQLRFFVGDANFRIGVQNYFKKYAWQNTERSDFLNAIASASGKDLTAWSAGWLESAGLNRVTPNWTCHAKVVKNFTIQQEATVAGLFLPHRSKVAFYKKMSNGSMKVFHIANIMYEGEKTNISTLVGKPCPDFVYLNYGDEDYALVNLDKESLSVAEKNINNFPEPMMRQMLWSTLYQMVRDTKLSTNSFLTMAAMEYPKEKNNTVLSQLIGRYSNTRNLYWEILRPEERTIFAPVFENSAWQAYMGSKIISDSSAHLLWLDHFIAIVHSPEGKQKLEALLANPKLDQDRRWKVLVELARLGDANAKTLIDAEKIKDPSSQGEKQAYAGYVAFPTLSNKKLYWEELSNRNNNLSIAKRMVGGAKFYNPNTPELTEAFVEPFFNLAITFDWSGENYVVRTIFESLFPSSLCRADLLQKSESVLDSNPQLPSHAKRAWLESNFELNKCIEMRAFNQNKLNSVGLSIEMGMK